MLLDYFKETRDYQQSTKDLYDSEFCQRLLRIFYIMVSIGNQNEIMGGILRKLIDSKSMKSLIHLFTTG